MNPALKDEEEDSDYDVFASVRPKGISVDDNLSDKLPGEDVDPFLEARPKNQETKKKSEETKKPEKQYGIGETLLDIGKQGLKETLIGVGGTWGDLQQLAGVNKEGEESDDQEEEDFYSRLKYPTTESLREVNKAIGGPGEAETPGGRYGGRIGKLYGSGVALGQFNPLPAVVGGIVGQGAEELGGSELQQTVAEIISMLLTPVESGKKLIQQAGKTKLAKKLLRGLGYTEEDVTLAVNAASKGKKLGIKASKGAKTEQAFEDFAEHSDELIANILEAEIPGFEKGAKHVHELASDAYGHIVDEAAKIKVKNLDPFFDTVESAIKEVEKVVGNSPEGKELITTLTKDLSSIIDNPTAEGMIYFYQRLGRLGKWVGRSQKDRIITNVKNSIKDTFKAEGKEGSKLADNFEKVNAGIQKAYKAEEISKIIGKATTQEGIDYKKLYKSFDKKENVKLFEDVLGKQQADNLRQISKVGKEVKDFDKAWKASNLLKGNAVVDTIKAGSAAYFLYKGDLEGLSYVLASKGLGVGAKKLAEQFLTNPKFQNLMIRGLHAIKNESPKAFSAAKEAMQKYFDEEKIDINLD